MTFALAANTWYKLEMATRYTSDVTSGLRYYLNTTGTFQTISTGIPGLGQATQNQGLTGIFQVSTTSISLRGNQTGAAANERGFVVVYFKTNAAGTGAIAIALNSGTNTGTNHEAVAVLSLF